MQPMRRSSNQDGPHSGADDMRGKLFALIKARSFRRGTIALASGRTSEFDFDMKPTMFDPAGASYLAELILESITALPVDYIGGLAIGAVPLIGSVTMLSHRHGRPIPGFFVRAQVKDHGTKRKIEGTSESLKDKNVVILEDVTTTGGSAMTAVNAAVEEGARVVLVLTVVDRLEGAIEQFRREGIPFQSIFTAAEFLAD
jgi:orotate phosphoribosyltransferase